MYSFKFISFLLAVCILSACAEKEPADKDATPSMSKTDETSSDVAELWEFHDVIYQIWHEAWPEKDTQKLKELIPDIEKGFTKLSAAELPGILRDKREDWSSGIKSMADIIAGYKDAAAAGQKEALLKAAEELHTQFEYLVRLIRPVMKEIDRFHQELYMLYHYYMPEYDLQKISDSAAELLKRVEAVNNATLPAKLADKQADFDSARKALTEALQELQQLLETNPAKETVDQAIEKVHDKYQSLIAVFE